MVRAYALHMLRHTTTVASVLIKGLVADAAVVAVYAVVVAAAAANRFDAAARVVFVDKPAADDYAVMEATNGDEKHGTKLRAHVHNKSNTAVVVDIVSAAGGVVIVVAAAVVTAAIVAAACLLLQKE